MAGAGTFASGAPGAALLAGGLALAAALFLAPGAARADDECGAATGNPATVSCPNADHAGGIVYNNQARSITLTVQGGHSSDHSVITTGTDGTRDSGVFLSTAVAASSAYNVAVTVGSAGEADIRQGATTQADGSDNNRGILIRQQSGGTTSLIVASWVTIGTSTTKMKAEGILLAFDASGAASASTVSVSAQPDIYSVGTGIAVDSYPGTGPVTVSSTANTSIATDRHGISVSHSGSAGAVTITHAGAITSASTTTHRGIEAVSTGKDSAGANHGVTVTSSGTISVASGGAGIHAAVGAARQEADTMHASYVAPLNAGLARVDVTGGSVTAKAGAVQALNYEAGSVRVDVTSGVTLTSTQGHGIEAKLSDVGNTAGTISVTNAATMIAAGTSATTAKHGITVRRAGGSGNVTVTNSGAITASGYGISAVAGGAGGTVSVTNSGALGTAEDRVSRGISASHNGTSGSLAVTSSGDVLATDYGVFAQVVAGNGADLRVEVTGGSLGADGRSAPAVAAVQKGTGSATIDVSSDATLTSKYDAGIRASIDHADNAAGQIAVTQGGMVSGRTGVYAEVSRASAMGETRAASAQPLIDVAWTGTFAQEAGTTAAGNARLAAADSGGAFAGPIAQHAVVPEAETAAATRYGTAAGIEAHALSWRDVAKEVAKGDDPGAFADKAAQDALFAAGADAATKARAAAVLATFRSQLASDRGAIPDVASVDANNDDSHSDAEITAYLTTDSANRRGFLRNILREHLSETEQAVLRAVVTDTGLDAAFVAGGATFSDDYKTAVRGFLDRFNVGNIRIAVNDGSINSRGDGVRAYYATPHAGNGRIEVSVAEDVTVTGGMAGVWVANAGMAEVAENSRPWGEALFLEEDTMLRQHFVTVDGTVTGGTDAAVHLSGGGALLVGGTGKVHAGSSGRAVLVNDPGHSEIVIHGAVRGGAGAPAAIDVTGGGRVVVGLTGSVDANGATHAIRAGKATPEDTRTTTVVLHTPLDPQVTGGLSWEAARDASARVRGSIGGEGLVANDEDQKQIVFGLTDGEGPTGQEVRRLVPRPFENGRPDLSRLPGDPNPTETPGTDGPGTDGPGTDGPGTDGPGTDGPGTDGPGTDGPGTDGPGTDGPGTDGPGTDGPGTDGPGTDGPGTDGPGTDGPGTDGPGTDGPGTDGPGTPGTDQPGTMMNCDVASDQRCRFYEALPSMLLAMNDLPTWAERRSAARDGEGAWVQVESAGGKWKADTSTRPDVAYDHHRHGVRAGRDFAVGEAGRVGVSVHGLRGSAVMTRGGGEARLTGTGVGVNAATAIAGDFYVDARAAVTWYDVDLSSSSGRALKDGAKGRGHALGVEAGRTMALGDGVSLTPRIGLAWSRVSLDDFTDARLARDSRVSMEDADSLAGRVGVMTAAGSEDAPGRVFASADVEHEFKEETSVNVAGARLETSARSTAVRLGVGGEFSVGEGVVLRARVDWATSGGDTSEYGGGVELNLRF